MNFRIPRCYDSHVHLAATGKVQSILNLKSVNSLSDLKSIKPSSNINPDAWIIGFGWDQFQWRGEFMNRHHLDQIFQDNPVCLTRVDGHAAVVNTAALVKADLFRQNIKSPSGGLIELGSDSYPSGLLLDMAKMLVDYKIPHPSQQETAQFLIKAVKTFNQAGFTHVRDMSSSLEQWNIAQTLIDQKQFTLAVEHNFTVENLSEIDKVIEQALYCKKNQTEQLRVDGIKIYLDGALGSSGAALSQNYHGEDQAGLLAWSYTELKEAFQKIWAHRLNVSIHGIGDAATDLITDVATKLFHENIKGRLNIEHAQMMSDKTIERMQNLDVVCYMQPCHWLSDKKWLSQKLGSLFPMCFRWYDLEQKKIPFYFGSDSPIESPSILNNYNAIEDANLSGIKKVQGRFENFHTHPDSSFMSHCFTQLQDGQVAVFWNGQKLTD